MCSNQMREVGVPYETRWWFQVIFYFQPYLGKWSWRAYFSDGLVQPPTRKDLNTPSYSFCLNAQDVVDPISQIEFSSATVASVTVKAVFCLVFSKLAIGLRRLLFTV